MTPFPMNTSARWLARPSKRERIVAAIISMAALWLIGAIDYLADYRLLFTVLYVLPIGYATVKVGRIYAIILAILSVVIWNIGDVLGGAPSPGMAIRLWNDTIVFALFTIVIYLLDALYRTLLGLETLVHDRTTALRQEMEERQRLEQQTLDLCERERQAFGHELHDVVCQDLASITIAGNMLTRKLGAKGLMEAEQAREITDMVDRALAKTRSVARGFFTAGFNVTGLAEALRENARNVRERTGVDCTVVWQENLLIQDEEVVMHFFRIAQEGIQNALKHGEPASIRVSLGRTGDSVQLVVEDDGMGIKDPDRPGQGLGLRIMRYRASLIHGEMRIEPASPRGTRIVCSVPLENIVVKEMIG